jgi:hypothetical protein
VIKPRVTSHPVLSNASGVNAAAVVSLAAVSRIRWIPKVEESGRDPTGCFGDLVTTGRLGGRRPFYLQDMIQTDMTILPSTFELFYTVCV